MAKRNDIIKMTFPTDINPVGELVGILYRPKGKKKTINIHSFETLPKLYVSGDGKQIIINGGKYKYGPRGFKG